MDTIKVRSGNAKMVAHRGVSGLELENTCAAFVAAGNRSYWGVETDVHVTADGKFIIIHDDNTGRVAVDAMVVEQTDYETLRSLQLKGKDGMLRTDLHLPSLEEYLSICKYYDKVCVLELKNPMAEEAVRQIVEICQKVYSLDKLVFISFSFQNMVYIRKHAPEAEAQYLLAEEITEAHMDAMAEYKLDLDSHYLAMSEELVKRLHDRGIKINCWTVDDPAIAEKLAAWGVDYITSSILE
jgi:glycerophosphoryl diester phosphodiesterase